MRRSFSSAAIALLLALAPARSAWAADVTAFVGLTSPRELWGNGYGAAFGTTWFKIATFEVEAARVPGETLDDRMTSFTGSAFLAPSFKKLTIYAGPGVGGYRQNTLLRTDNGILKTFAVGAKLKLGLAMLRGEWRYIKMPSDALIPVESRIYVGAGIDF
jgi:hypothetical protein